MKNLTTFVNTMSSVEIAELTGKRHDHVMRDIKNMLECLNPDSLNAPQFWGTYKTEQGNIYDCFNLPKRETLILISGYDVVTRAKIIDRWQELENNLQLNHGGFARILSVFKGAKSLGLHMKMTEDEAILFANKTTLKLTGFDAIGILGINETNKTFVNQQLIEHDNALKERICDLVNKNNGITLGVVCNRLRKIKKSSVKQLLEQMVQNGVIKKETHKKRQNSQTYYSYYAV